MSKLQQRIQSSTVTPAGRFLYRCLPYRKKVIKANIQQAFGSELNNEEQIRLTKAFYSHFCTSLKEMIWARCVSQKRLSESVEVRGVEHLLKIAEEGKGLLILTGHFGNWELAPIAGIMNFKDYKGTFHFIRKTLKVKWLERMLFRRYYKAGLHVIPKKNSLNKVCDALSENHAVVFVLDQHATIANRDGIAAEFFGKKAGTYRSLASLARHTGVPVVPAAAYRMNKNKHVLEFHDPIEWEDKASSQEAIYHNTCRYNKAIEQIIRQNPEQWLWLHKRWKLKE